MKDELYNVLISRLEELFVKDVDNNQEVFVKIGILSKYIKTMKAILLLDSQGYFEDAQILVRTLFEIAVNVAYCEHHRTYIRFLYYSFVLRKEYLDLLKSRNIQEIDQELVIEIEEGYFNFKNEYGKGSLYNWNGISFINTVKDVTKSYSSEDILMMYESIYKTASGHVHSDSLSTIRYINLDDIKNNVIDYKPDAYPNDEYLRVYEDVKRISDFFLQVFAPLGKKQE